MSLTCSYMSIVLGRSVNAVRFRGQMNTEFRKKGSYTKCLLNTKMHL